MNNQLGDRQCTVICEVELEEGVSGQKREQHATRIQLLIPNPLQTNKGLLG